MTVLNRPRRLGRECARAISRRRWLREGVYYPSESSDSAFDSGVACSVLRPIAVITIFWQDSIEALTGYDRNQHDGTVNGWSWVGAF